eukprot:TRINITY_DN8726_c0_g1_i6.p2 TRINITY_DN8726_c0_g1~~TRINITY_DN8726_c0_g1_i6.p2  ORF type:complete len:152 (+),score=11.87 TRINITY_DN8726_c0_g1_i6:56-511(+)
MMIETELGIILLRGYYLRISYCMTISHSRYCIWHIKMSLILLLAMGLVWGNDDLVTTPDYVEYLKSAATWEVTDYEDSIFKGWTMDDAKHLLGKKTQAQPYEALLATPKANHPSSLNWVNTVAVIGIERSEKTAAVCIKCLTKEIAVRAGR